MVSGRNSDSCGKGDQDDERHEHRQPERGNAAKISESETFGATDLTINTLMPTGGEISPISSVSTTKTPNQIGSIPKFEHHRKKDRQGQHQHCEPLKETPQHKINEKHERKDTKDGQVERDEGFAHVCRQMAKCEERVDHMCADQDQHDRCSGDNRTARCPPEIDQRQAAASRCHR